LISRRILDAIRQLPLQHLGNLIRGSTRRKLGVDFETVLVIQSGPTIWESLTRNAARMQSRSVMFVYLTIAASELMPTNTGLVGWDRRLDG
jgi:hypothetical protein